MGDAAAEDGQAPHADHHQARAPLSYHAHYDMNRSNAESRERFLGRVRSAMRSF